MKFNRIFLFIWQCSFLAIIFAATVVGASNINVTGTVHAMGGVYVNGVERISSSGVGTFEGGTTVGGIAMCMSDGSNCLTSSQGSGWRNTTTQVILSNNATNLSIGPSGVLFVNTANRRVGINVTTPLVKLHVQNGSFLINGTEGVVVSRISGSTLYWDSNQSAFRAGFVDDNSWSTQVNISSYSTGIGYNVLANGTAAVGLGYLIHANASTGGVAMGYAANASGLNGVALGYEVWSQSRYGAVIGYRSYADSNAGSVAIGGVNRLDSSTPSVGIGNAQSIQSLSSGSVSIGSSNSIYGSGSVVIGALSGVVNGPYAVAIGYDSNTTGQQGSIAIGRTNNVNGSYGSVGIGFGVNTSGIGNVAIGTFLNAAGSDYSYVIGSGRDDTAAFLINNVSFSIMIGFNSTRPVFFANQTHVGINTITPTGTLEVNGTINASAVTFFGGNNICTQSNGNCANTGLGVGSSGWLNTSTKVILANNQTSVSVGSTPALFVDVTNSRVGINTGTPAQTLDVNGSVNVTDTIYAYGGLEVYHTQTYGCDFLPTQSTTMCYPNFVGAAITSGTSATLSGNVTRPGIVRMSDTTAANTGYRYMTDIVSLQLNGSEVFKASMSFVTLTFNNNSMTRIGFHDSTSSTNAVDGVFFEVINKTAGCVARSNNAQTTSTVNLSIATGSAEANAGWYGFKITIGQNGTWANCRIYNLNMSGMGGTLGELLYDQNLTSNIPRGGLRETGAGVLSIGTTAGTATVISYIDYMEMRIQTTRRAVW